MAFFFLNINQKQKTETKAHPNVTIRIFFTIFVLNFRKAIFSSAAGNSFSFLYFSTK